MIFSILGFAEHLAEMAVEVDLETKAALEEAADVVQREAKDSLGTYQAAAGPFAGWAELADKTKEDRLRQGFTENDPGLRAGDMRDSIEKTVEFTPGPIGRGEAHIGSDAPEMEYFELGTPTQLPRSVLGGALFRKADEVKDICGDRVAGALVGAQVHNRRIPVL